MTYRDVKPPNMKIKAEEIRKGDVIYKEVPPAQATNAMLIEPFFIHSIYDYNLDKDLIGLIYYHVRYLELADTPSPVPTELDHFDKKEIMLVYRYSLNKILKKL